MPHLYPSKNKGWRIIYRVFFIDGRHTDKTRWASSKDKAKIIYSDVDKLENLSRKAAITKQEVLYCLNRGYISQTETSLLTSSKVSIYTWNELAKKYEDWSRENCRAISQKANMTKLKNVLKFTDRLNKAPSEVAAADIEAYIKARRQAKIKNATIRKEIVIFRKMLDNLGADNPARQTKLPKVDDEHIPRALEYEEILALLQTLKKRKRYLYGYLRPVVMTYLYAGLRPSEMVRLMAKDIRAGKILIHGETKTGMLRNVEIHPKLKVCIESCIRRGGKYLFGGDRQLDPNSISREIRRTIREAELDEGATPYSLRHTFVTNLLRTSNDLRYTMDKAGHKRLATTTRYLHIIPNKESPLKKMKFGS